jgi:hypothetical protein
MRGFVLFTFARGDLLMIADLEEDSEGKENLETPGLWYPPCEVVFPRKPRKWLIYVSGGHVPRYRASACASVQCDCHIWNTYPCTAAVAHS